MVAGSLAVSLVLREAQADMNRATLENVAASTELNGNAIVSLDPVYVRAGDESTSLGPWRSDTARSQCGEATATSIDRSAPGLEAAVIVEHTVAPHEQLCLRDAHAFHAYHEI